MTSVALPSSLAGHRTLLRAVGALPFAAILALWWAAPHLVEYPAYMLPSPGHVVDKAIELARDGSLWTHIGASLSRLGLAFVIGSVLAMVLGIAIATSRAASDYLRPTLTFLQSIAGIAWVPLAIIWLGIGVGAVVFVIANTIFFSALNNAVTGVQQIPTVLYRAVRSHGAGGWRLLTELILPGALVQIILGLRTSMAYGWRALVAGEMIAGTDGLGYLTMEAVRWYQTETVILGMILIGILWLAIDRLVFVPLERRTVLRWGVMTA
jgi:NitT/TauT family transport system permease protein/taurine transport system permease protein